MSERLQRFGNWLEDTPGLVPFVIVVLLLPVYVAAGVVDAGRDWVSTLRHKWRQMRQEPRI